MEELFEVSFFDGMMVICSFIVMVEDIEVLVIFCLEEIMVFIDFGECFVIVIYDLFIVIDNCFLVDIFIDNVLGLGVSFLIGSIEEIYEVIDGSGNVMFCIFIVIVEDMEVFIISCLIDFIVLIDLGECIVMVIYDEFIVVDNCLGVMIVFEEGFGIGGVFLIGVIIEFYMVIDVVGNIILCFFIVIVEDIEMFIIICFIDFEVDIDFGDCVVVVSYSELMVIDNCLGVVVDFLVGFGNGVIFLLGVFIESYVVMDVKGNIVNCEFMVIVKDIEMFDLVCLDDLVVLIDFGLCVVVVNYEVVIVIDNCMDVVFI